MKTHYDNLQVTRNASQRVIRAAYKTLSQEWHPDKHPNDYEKAGKIMQIINTAYSVLSDPVKKAAHDEWIDAQPKDSINERKKWTKENNNEGRRSDRKQHKPNNQSERTSNDNSSDDEGEDYDLPTDQQIKDALKKAELYQKWYWKKHKH